MSTSVVAALAPYKGLAPFEDSELDALLFFGRERETEIIVSNLLATRLTVLYGPSGVGKSSILRAAVARRLRALEPDATVALLDDWAEEPELPEADFLILDQFEEYFLYQRDGTLAERLAGSRAHVLIALREDQLAQLDAFQAQLPNVFANRLRLGHLDESAARAAIVGPLDSWNAVADESRRVGIETALVAAVLSQVATAPNQIEAPYLQLVMERVWDEEHAAGSRVLREATLERLGGAEAIVGAHLERALDALPPREAEIATNALRFLVTPSRTKIAHTLDDLVGYTNESPVVLQQVLELLATQRVLRAGDGGRYEIFHDVLAEPVLVWRREREGRAALVAAQRRHRRLAVLAGASLALAAFMVVLTVYAFSQRSEASKQRRTAEQQTELAQARLVKAQQETERARRFATAALVQRKRAEQATQAAKTSEQKAESSAEVAQANEQQAQQSQAAAQQSAQQSQASEEKAKQSETKAKQSATEAQKSKKVAQREAALQRVLTRKAKVGAYVATAEKDLDTDPVAGTQAAVNAARYESSPRVETALRDSLLHLRTKAVFRGGGGALDSAVLSPDASQVALGSARGKLRVFDAATHRLLHEYDAGSAVNVVRFSPDGSQLAVGTAKGAFLFRDGRVAHVLAPARGVLDAAFAGGGRYVVTGGVDLTTRIWNAATGELLATMPATAAQAELAVNPAGDEVAVLSKGQAIAKIYAVPDGHQVDSVQQPGEVTTLGFSPDGKYLVTAGRRNGFVWDAQSFQPVHTLTGHSAPINDLAFGPDGSVVTVSVDSSGMVWNPATGQSTFTLCCQHQQKVLAVAVDPSGNIATGSADNTVRFWEQPLGETPVIFGGHTDSVTDLQFSRDGNELLSTSMDGTARLWDSTVPKLSLVGAHAAAVTGVAVGPGGTTLSGGQDGTAKLWRGGRSLTLTHGGKVVHASWDGADVLTAGDDGTAKRWRASDGALLATYPHGAAVRTALPLAGGVVTFGADGSVKGWTAGGTSRWSQSQGSALTAGAVSRAGIVASGATDGSLRLWRADGTARPTLRAHTAAVTSLAFSPDGKLLVSGGSDSVAYIWNVANGQKLQTLGGHQNGITSVSFSPDATRVLTAGADGDVRIWRVRDGKQLQRLKFHVSTIGEAAFSSDGRWVVTAGPSAAGIWQARTGFLVYALRGAKGSLTAATWAPGSQRIVVGDTGGTVTTFTCSLCVGQPALLAQAKARLAALRRG